MSASKHIVGVSSDARLAMVPSHDSLDTGAGRNSLMCKETCDANLVYRQKVIVAGDSRGIGRSIALAIAAEGADRAICARGDEGFFRRPFVAHLRPHEENAACPLIIT